MHMRSNPILALLTFALICDARADDAIPGWEKGVFSWKAGGPLLDVGAGRDAADPHVALKDPTIVFHDGRWHLFGTLRMKSGRVCMQYFNFTNWAQANGAPREVISFTEKYHCAPQVFWFKKVRTSPGLLFVVAMIVNVGMWLERYVIIVVSLSRDFLPSSWGMYHGTVFDWSMFVGSIGLFIALLFLFLRFLPMISIFEMRTILPGAKMEEEA